MTGDKRALLQAAAVEQAACLDIAQAHTDTGGVDGDRIYCNGWRHCAESIAAQIGARRPSGGAGTECWRILGLIVAEFEGDPLSVQCFDHRLVDEAIRLVRDHEKEARR